MRSLINPFLIRFHEIKSSSLFDVFKNFSWLSIDKIIQLVVGVFIFGWVARYLGPDEFGTYNYALAYIALFSALTTLGLSGIVVRDLVRNPDKKNEILGTVIGMKLIGAFLAFIFIILSLFVVQRGNTDVTKYIAIAAVGFLFLPFSTIDLWFQSQIKSKYVVIPNGFSFLITTFAYILAILTNQSLSTFIWITVIGSFLNAIGLLISYLVVNIDKGFWRFRIRLAGKFLRQSWLLILSGLGAMINLKIDQVMIGRLIDSNEVGIYSAAVKLSEVWYFVPTFIVISIFPILIRSRERDITKYRIQVQQLYDFLVSIALIVAIFGSIFAKPVINVIYGSQYLEAGPILSIHIWAGIFIFMGEVLSKWLINEDLLFYSPIRHGAGGIINILLNLFLIPRFGGIGAAISTVISYATSSYLVCFFHPRTRIAARMMTKSLLFPFRSIYIAIRS